MAVPRFRNTIKRPTKRPISSHSVRTHSGPHPAPIIMSLALAKRCTASPYPYIIQSGQQLFIPAPGVYSGPPPPPPAAGYYEQPAQGYAPQAPGNEYYPPQAPGNEYYPPQAPGNDYYAPEDNSYYANPDNAGTHTVGPGETLYSIALNYGTSSEALASANGLVNPNQIYVGQVLYLP